MRQAAPGPRRSLSTRLTLCFAAAATGVLLALGYLILQAVDRHFVEQDTALVQGKLELARHALAKLHSADDLAQLPQTFADSLIGHHGLVLAVIDGAGRPLFATPGMRLPTPLQGDVPLLALPSSTAGVAADMAAHSHPSAAAMAVPALRTWHDGSGEYRGIAVRVASNVPHMAPLQLIVATEISHHSQFLAEFRRTLWIFVTAAALVTGLLGYLLTRHALAPLEAMRAAANRVNASQLHARLPSAAVPAELAELARTLNDMLARLEDSFRRLSDFASDLAHELRTPISNLMTQTQVALSQARSAEAYRDVLYSNLEEFERLASMLAELLFLAKADNGMLVPQRVPVALEDELAKLFEFYEALAEASALGLQLRGAASVSGDPAMLRRALSNLLANAVRHARPGSQIEADIQALGEDQVELSLSNQGETIAAEHLPHLFERFYRADPARQRSSEGAGLGLAITRSIVEAHGGHIRVQSHNGLTRFSVVLPR